MAIVAFLPIHGVSERVPEKEFRPFAGIEGGLTALKIRQLQRVDGLDAILVSIPMNEYRERLIAAAQQGMTDAGVPVAFLEEPDHHGGTDGLIRWVAEATRHDPADTVVLFTHVTSPFFDETWYAKALSAYRSRVGHGHDSMASAVALNDFLWGLNGPLNWNRLKRRWPRTQELQPFRIIHSAVFMAPLSIYREQGDRIGQHPFLFLTSKTAALDVDWPEDWEIAETLWRAREN